MSKKTEFYQIDLLEILLPVGKKYLCICDKSGNVQFGKTQFFETPCMYYEGKQDEREKKGFDLENRFHQFQAALRCVKCNIVIVQQY